jgi:hypothetical protein
MTDAPLIGTPARLRSVALHEEHRIVFNAKAFVGDGVVRIKDDNRSYAMSEEEWDLHVSVLRCWDTGGEGLDKAAYRRKHRRFYEKLKNFKVTTTDAYAVLKRSKVEKDGSKTWRMVVHQEEVFDAISEAHLQVGHKKVGQTNNCVNEKYHNITEAQVKVFRKSCPICSEEQPRLTMLAGAKKPIMSSNFRDRFQVDLIDMRSSKMKDWNGIMMRWIMVVKDHFTKLVYLRALPYKEAILVAHELSHIMGLLGFPLVFHTDNGGEF